MARILPISNGNLMVNFDRAYNLRDIYYPLIGQENHGFGCLSRLGFFIDNRFSWLNDAQWQRDLHFKKETMVTNVSAANGQLSLTVNINDVIDVGRPVYLRKISIRNERSCERQIKIFFHHDLSISGHAIGDTAYFEPDMRALVHYKGKRYFLFNVLYREKHGFDSCATGIKYRGGSKGTWFDAEDGRLEGGLIAHGSVDSTGAVQITLPPCGSVKVYWWMTAGENYSQVEELNRIVLKRGPEFFLERTSSFWKLWVNTSILERGDLSAELEGLYRRSLLILRAHADNRGGIIAAADSDTTSYNGDTYCYVWPRDGARSVQALVRAGYFRLVASFFEFCARCLTREGYLLHKYNPDGSAGSSWHPWINKDGERQLPIQEDETALVLHALWEYYMLCKDIEGIRLLYGTLIKPAAAFLYDYIDVHTGLPRGSYDIWEEEHGTTAYTAGAVWAGLEAAARFTHAFGETSLSKKYSQAARGIKEAVLQYMYDTDKKRFLRMVRTGTGAEVEPDYRLDSSLCGLFLFGMFEPSHPYIISTMQAIERNLWCQTDYGGVARYYDDPYLKTSRDVKEVPGNPWFVSTLWLADWYIDRAVSIADLEKPLSLLKWIQTLAMPGGTLPEQFNPYTGEPLSAAPLVWSHAELAITIQKYASRVCQLREEKKEEVLLSDEQPFYSL